MRLCCFALLLTGLFNTAFAKNKVEFRIGMSEIPNLLSKSEDNQGPYNKIVKRLFDADNTIDIQFIPPSRADVLFSNKQLDCLFPGNIAGMDNRNELIQSTPVHINQAYIFTKQAYSNLANFDTQLITMRRGLSYGMVVERINARYLEVNTDRQSIELLKLGRIDGFIAYLLDAQGTYQQLGLPINYYNPELPVFGIPESLICHNTPANQKLINTSNEKILEMQNKNEIQHWLNALSRPILHH